MLSTLPIHCRSWYLQEPLYVKWKQWDCRSDCRYNSMLLREEKRRTLREKPTKYYGRWPFCQVYEIQEPVSVTLSALNLSIHFQGWISFFILVYYKLPMMRDQKAYYEFTGLSHIYGILAMNCWFWAAVFHSRYGDEHKLTAFFGMQCSSAKLMIFRETMNVILNKAIMPSIFTNIYEKLTNGIITTRRKSSSPTSTLNNSLLNITGNK